MICWKIIANWYVIPCSVVGKYTSVTSQDLYSGYYGRVKYLLLFCNKTLFPWMRIASLCKKWILILLKLFHYLLQKTLGEAIVCSEIEDKGVFTRSWYLRSSNTDDSFALWISLVLYCNMTESWVPYSGKWTSLSHLCYLRNSQTKVWVKW